MQQGSEPLTFLHGDHLNSTVLATRGGAANGQKRYYAYGKDRLATATVPTDNRFTGQKEDGTGLVHMNARYHDPVTGQFVSPDMLAPPHPWCVDCRLTLKRRLPFCAEEAYKISVPRKLSGVYHHGTIRGLSAVPKHASTETRLSSHRPICVVGQRFVFAGNLRHCAKRNRFAWAYLQSDLFDSHAELCEAKGIGA